MKHMYKIMYLMYKHSRAPFGVPFGFILMFSAFTDNLTLPILLPAFGFFAIELFGGFYNDYWDYEEDKRNNRKDKFTTTGLLNRKHVLFVSLSVASAGLFMLLFTNLIIFLIGIYYTILLVLYSHPLVRLKGKIKGYATLSSKYLLLPIGLTTLFTVIPSIYITIFFTLFFFSQEMYLLFQKDSTDMKDDSNLFIKHGWLKATKLCAIFGFLSSIFLLNISLNSIFLFVVWIFNIFPKFFNIQGIYLKTITRSQRNKFILLEFFTPFLYSIGGFLG